MIALARKFSSPGSTTPTMPSLTTPATTPAPPWVEASNRPSRQETLTISPAPAPLARIRSALQLRTAGWHAAEKLRERRQPAVEILPGQARRLDLPFDRADWKRRIALRTAHGTYLAASMDRERVVQSPLLASSALFELRPSASLDGDGWPRSLLVSLYGTCVDVSWLGRNPQAKAHPPRQLPCGSSVQPIEIVALPSSAAHASARVTRVAIRAHGTNRYLSAAADERRVEISHQQGRAEAFEMVNVSAPPVARDGTLRVSGVWEPAGQRASPRHRRGAWCVEWYDLASDAGSDARPHSHLRLCFNATSSTEYMETRRQAAPLTGLPVSAQAAPTRRWERSSERALSLKRGSPFALEVRLSSGVVSYSLNAGGWVSATTSLTHAQIGVSGAAVVSYGSALGAVRLWCEESATHAEESTSLQLLPPIRLPHQGNISDAPREYVQTPSAFRLYNPSLAWRTGDRVTTDGITGRDSSVIHVFAKMSSYSLCGASDEYDSVAASRRGQLLSFLVRLDMDEASGAVVGGVHALSKVNDALTRHVSYGDGPEDPRAVRLGKKMIVLLWARTGGGLDAPAPEYTTFAAVYPASGLASEGLRKPRLVKLRQAGCDLCKQKNWAPFVWRGDLYAEVGIEPRLVLRIDLRSGVASPPEPSDGDASAGVPTASSSMGSGADGDRSFGGAAELQRVVGATLHGGPPPIRVGLGNGTRRAFLGLAHFNRLLPTSRPLRIYHHVFYLFAPHPPFSLLATGPPFMFPTETGLVQFASGLLPSADGTALTISFGEQDCEARRATVSLTAVLAELSRGVVG